MIGHVFPVDLRAQRQSESEREWTTAEFSSVQSSDSPALPRLNGPPTSWTVDTAPMARQMSRRVVSLAVPVAFFTLAVNGKCVLAKSRSPSGPSMAPFSRTELLGSFASLHVARQRRAPSKG